MEQMQELKKYDFDKALKDGLTKSQIVNSLRNNYDTNLDWEKLNEDFKGYSKEQRDNIAFDLLYNNQDKFGILGKKAIEPPKALQNRILSNNQIQDINQEVQKMPQWAVESALKPQILRETFGVDGFWKIFQNKEEIARENALKNAFDKGITQKLEKGEDLSAGEILRYYNANDGMQGHFTPQSHYKEQQKLKIIAQTNFENLDESQKQELQRQNRITRLWNSQRELHDKLKDEVTKREADAYDKARAEQLERDIINLQRTHQNILKYGADFLRGSTEQSDKYKRMIQESAISLGFDGIGFKGDRIYAFKGDKAIFIDDGFFKNLGQILGTNAFDIAGSITGAIAGAKRGVGKIGKLAGAVAGGAVGAGMGGIADSIIAQHNSRGEVNLADALLTGAESATFDVAGGLIVSGGAKAVKGAVKGTIGVMRWFPPITPTIRNTIGSENIQAAKELIEQTFTQEQKDDILAFSKSFGGNLELQDKDTLLTKSAEFLTQKYGADSKIAQVANALENYSKAHNKAQGREDILTLIRADETGQSLGVLLEVAKNSPEANKNLRDILNATSYKLKKEIEGLGLKENDFKKVFRDFKKGTQEDYDEAFNKILENLYEGEKVVLNRESYAKFREEMGDLIILDPQGMNFLNFVEKGIYNPNGVSLAQLNNARKQLNKYQKKDYTQNPSTQDFIDKAVKSALRDDIEKGANEIFLTRPEQFERVRKLYDTALSDYSAMNKTFEILDVLDFNELAKTNAELMDNLIKFVQGDGGTNEINNYALLTKGLKKEQIESLELNALNRIYEKNILKDRNDRTFEVFNSAKFLEDTQKLQEIFQSENAKKFIEIMQGFNRLFGNDAIIALKMEYANPPKEGSAIAQSVEGTIEQKIVKGIFGILMRNLPTNNKIVGILGYKERVRKMALAHHIEQALKSAYSINDFTFALKKISDDPSTPSPTRQVIMEFGKDLMRLVQETRENADIDKTAQALKESEQNADLKKKIEFLKEQKRQELRQKMQERMAKERAESLKLKEAQQEAQRIKNARVGKTINEIDLNLQGTIQAKSLKPTRINLENKSYPANFVIINKNDLKPNFNTTGTQGRTQKQENIIKDIQDNLNSDKLFFNEGGFDGLPVILQDGSVSVGNHRAEALKNLSQESLDSYKQSAKEVFGVDLKDDELIVRMLDENVPKQEILNLSFASNIGREQNLSEKALSTLGKYQENLDKLPQNISAQNVEEMQQIVAKALDKTNNGLNTLDTNLALLSSLARSKDKNILDALNSLKGDAEQKAKVVKMFVENAGNFHNLAKQTQMPNLDLRDYLTQALYFTAKADKSRVENFKELAQEIKSIIQTTDTQGKNALIQDESHYNELIGKALGYSFARFRELENPSGSFFDFLSNIKLALSEELEPTLFSAGRHLSSADIYDFLSVSIKSGIPSDETSEVLELLPQLKAKHEAFKANIDTQTQKAQSKAQLNDISFTDSKGKEHILSKETQEQWLKTFNLKSLDDSYIPQQSKEIQEALGGKEIRLQLGSLKKLVSQGREEFIPQIKQVLETPEAIIKDSDNAYLFVKHLKDEDYFVNVSVDKGEYLVSISNGIKETNNIQNKLLNDAELIYQSPNASSNLQTLLQASRYSTNKIDNEIIPQLDNPKQELLDLYKQEGELIKQYHLAKSTPEKMQIEIRANQVRDSINALKTQQPDEIIDVEFIAKEPSIQKRIEWKKHNIRAEQIRAINEKLAEIDKEATSNLVNGDMLGTLRKQYELLEKKKAEIQAKQLESLQTNTKNVESQGKAQTHFKNKDLEEQQEKAKYIKAVEFLTNAKSKKDAQEQIYFNWQILDFLKNASKIKIAQDNTGNFTTQEIKRITENGALKGEFAESLKEELRHFESRLKDYDKRLNTLINNFESINEYHLYGANLSYSKEILNKVENNLFVLELEKYAENKDFKTLLNLRDSKLPQGKEEIFKILRENEQEIYPFAKHIKQNDMLDYANARNLREYAIQEVLNDKELIGKIAKDYAKAHKSDLEKVDLKKVKGFKVDSAREDIEKLANLTPIKEFGTNYAEFYRDGKGGIAKILAEADDFAKRQARGEIPQDEVYKGQVAGAFYRGDLKELSGNGNIDLVWGEIADAQAHKGYGLAHIVDKHPDFDLNLIPQIVEKGKLVNQNNVRFRLESENYAIGLSGEFKGNKQNFIITAFERNKDLDTLSPKPKITDKSDNTLSNLDRHYTTIQSNANTKIELTEEKLQNTLKQIPQENELENITQKYLKDIAEAKEVETKTQLTLEFLEKKHEHLIREKYEFLDAIKKEGFSQSEIQEAKEHIKNNAKKLFADDNRYLEVPSMIENEMPINLMAKDKSDEQLAKEFLERQEHRRADSIYREIDDIKKTMGRIKWDFENKWSPANLKRLEKTLERIQKNVEKQKKESFKIESMTYDLNTKEGEAKVRELFAYTKTNAEQKELFELILPIARNLGVRVRHALNDIDGKHIAGRYTYKENMARVKHNGNIKNELKGQVLLHELIHSVTSRAIHAYENNAKEILSPRQINAIKNIKDIYKQIKETGGLGLEMYKGYNLGGDYGLKNAHELIAELSNPSFVEKLKKINVFEKLIDNIVKLFVSAKEMLGLKRINAYEKLREQVVEIVQNYKPNFARDYEANFKRYIKSESEELESLSKPDSLASASNSIESAVKTQEMGDIAHEAPNIAKTDDEIIPQIQQKFNFDETKAKDLYEWHKDSSPLTKDENGIPKVFYHGSSADKKFNVFDKSKIHSGYGFWFGSNPKDKAVIEAKTGNTPLYKVFLKIKKPFILENLNKDNIKDFEKVFGIDLSDRLKLKESVENLENIVKKELDIQDAYYITPYWWEIKQGDKWQVYGDKDFLNLINPEIKKQIDKTLENLPQQHRGYFMLNLPRAYNADKQIIERILNTLKNLGYDGIDNYGEIVVFDSNQIKAVENKGLKGENGKREYFNESSPNIYQSNSHLGAGLLSGSVSGFQTDEQGNLSFNPQNFLLGLAGGAVGSKAIAQGFKALKSNPELKAKVTQELANTLSKGWESATQKYPILSTLEPRYIAKSERGRIAQSEAILKVVESREIYKQRKSTKEALSHIVGQEIVNKQGFNARLTIKSVEKMLSQSAINKSVANGFNEIEHLSAVKNIKNLFENSVFKETSKDKSGAKNVLIHRFNAPFNDDNALITVKETILGSTKGKRLYSVELELIHPTHSTT